MRMLAGKLFYHLKKNERMPIDREKGVEDFSTPLLFIGNTQS